MMKKNLISALMGLTMLAALMLTISACGGSDSSSSDTPGGGDAGGGGTAGAFQGARRVFGSNLVKAYGREGYDRHTVTYDANGFVTKIHRDRYSGTTIDKTEDVIITYNGNVATGALYENGAFKQNMILTVGSNGFVSKIESPRANQEFEYDAAGYFVKMKYIPAGSTRVETLSLNWQNNDFLSGGWTGDLTTLAYTDATHGTPIENVAGVLQWDDIMGIDMDDDFTYVTGAIGFGPKHLPLAWSDSGTQATISWTLDAQGRAIKAVVTKSSGGGYTRTYFWEY